jgi:hypothetical protein
MSGKWIVSDAGVIPFVSILGFGRRKRYSRLFGYQYYQLQHRIRCTGFRPAELFREQQQDRSGYRGYGD